MDIIAVDIERSASVLALVSLSLNLGLLLGKKAIKDDSQRAHSLLVAHTCELLLMGGTFEALSCNLVAQSFRYRLDQVLRAGGRLLELAHIELVLDVFFLGAQHDDHMEGSHGGSHENALDVNPEDLPAGPGVGKVEEAGSNCRQVDNGELEESVPGDSLVVLHAILEAGQVAGLPAHAAVLEAEELEGGQHGPDQDPLLGPLVSEGVLVEHTVLAFEQAGLDELVEDVVQCAVCNQGEEYDDRAAAMAILHQERQLVEPEASHPRALQRDKASDGLRPLVFPVADGDCNEKSDWSSQRDKWRDSLARPVAALLIVHLVVRGALRNASVLVEVESCDARQAGICRALTGVAGLEAELTLPPSRRVKLDGRSGALGQALSVQEERPWVAREAFI